MSSEEETTYDGFNDMFNDNYTYDYVEPCGHNNNHSTEMVVGPYINSIICILGFVGNGLVIVTYAFYKRTKSMTDVYLLNVAVADLLFVVALPLIVYNEMTSWSMGRVACKLLRGSYSINLYSGMLLLACISTDRYIAIVQARRSFRLRSLTYSRLICGVVWTFAILMSIPTFYLYDLYEPKHNDFFMLEEELNHTSPSQNVCEFRLDMTQGTNMDQGTNMNQWTNVTQWTNETHWTSMNQGTSVAQAIKVALPSTQLAVGFFLPLTIMIFCYSAIIVTLLRAKNFQRHKAVRVVLVVVAVFIICHLPYNVALLYDTVSMFNEHPCEESDALQTAMTILQSFAYLHCCLNPVLYAFVGVKFRNHFRKIFQDLWCLGKRYIAPRRFSRVTSEVFVSTIRRSVDGSSENGSSFTM